MSGPDKPKVIDEVWSDERVKGFLAIEPYDGAVNPDFNVLMKAYQAMRAEDFERFVGFFTEAGRDLNAVNEQSKTMLDLISHHRRSVAYAETLKAAGAEMTGAA